MSSRAMVVDISALPEYWPTQIMPAEFWEELGRTVATFGLLEEMIKKTCFVLSATRKYESVTTEMYERWTHGLEKMVKDPLGSLIDRFEKELKADESHDLNLIHNLRDLKEHRDILCHGSWRPGSDGKQLRPLFVNRKSEICDSEYSVDDLREIRRQVVEVLCLCMNTGTSKGIQLPWSNDPGVPIWQG